MDAPLANIATIVPSLDSTPSKSNDHIAIAVPYNTSAKTEVKFETASSSSESESDEAEELHEKPKIPDGGWGWMVVLASLILSMIADGISLSFGLLYVEFVSEFGASNSSTSWIGSLFMAVPLILGPVMSAFVDKYGCRSMTVLGGLISAFGFIISSRVTSLNVMFLTFGVIAGLGLGLCYVTAVVAIPFWFDKKRTLAVGLGAAGTGIGTFVFSPLTNLLLSQFGWRTTTLLLSSGFFVMCLCGCLMREPDWVIYENNEKLSKSGKSSKTSLGSNTCSTMVNNGPVMDLEELKALLNSGKDAEYFLQHLETSMHIPPDSKLNKNLFRSVLSLPTFIKQNEKVPVEVLEQLSSNKRLYNVILENYPSLLLWRSTSDKGLNVLEENYVPERYPVTISVKLKKSPLTQQNSLPEENLNAAEPLLHKSATNPSEFSPSKRNSSFPWLKRHALNNPNYMKNMKFHRQSLVHRGAIINMNKYRLRASSCPNIYRVSMTSVLQKGEQKWYSELVELLKTMFDFSLFLELHFFLMSLSTVILFVWFIVPYFYLADHMNRFNYTREQVSFTIANIGVTNTFGMVFLGWAGDQPWMNITKTYAVCLVLCGCSCAGMMFFTYNYILLQISAGCFGIFLSSSFSFTPGILMELVPLDQFTVAYGLQLLCMGIGNLFGPPFAGHLFDVTGNWEQSFYQAAIWTAFSGVIVAIIPFTKNRKLIGSGPVQMELN